MKVVWSALALADIENHYRYIAEFNPIAAVELAEILHAFGAGLDKFPKRGRPGRVAGTRELIRAPYIIVYRITSKRVEISRVWHGAQDLR